MTIDFSGDLKEAERALSAARKWGKLGSFFTFGIWCNEKAIRSAEAGIAEARSDAMALADLLRNLDSMREFLDAEVQENGVRIALCVFPDIALDGHATYGPFWSGIRQSVLERDQYRCSHEDGSCNGPLQIHHIRPLSKGGTNDLLNLLTICRYHHALQHPGNPAFMR